MEIIAFVTLSTGTKIKLTEEDYNKFCEADNDDFIEASGKTFKKSAVMQIEDISEFAEENNFNYHQPYSLPSGIGFTGIITREKRLKGIELLAKGLQKAKDKTTKQGRNTNNIDKLLEIARNRYKTVKAN